MRVAGPRRTRKAVVVFAGPAGSDIRAATAVAASLQQMGIETPYVGREDCPQRIAAIVVAEGADAVELCLGSSCGVRVLKELLHELIALGRRDVSIVVHRAMALGRNQPYR